MAKNVELHDRAVIIARAAADEVWTAALAATPSLTLAEAAVVTAKARAAGIAAAEPIYLAAGYHRCVITGCTRLASPDFRVCKPCSDSVAAR